MNIKDVKKVNLDLSMDLFEFLYSEQEKLYQKYKDIEGIPEAPLNINVSENQSWIKDFFWRVVEELHEFYEAYLEDNEEHKIDELSDALHFLIEVYVLLGDKDRIKLDEFISNISYVYYSEDEVADLIFNIMNNLAFASNSLKNRKWKKTQVLVDEEIFFKYLDFALFQMIQLIANSFGEDRCNKKSIAELYYLKNKVNQFRIESNY